MAIVTTERKITATAADGKKMTLGELSLFLASLEAAGVDRALTPAVRAKGLGGIRSITVTVREDTGDR
jgi:hypothetical protein